MRPARLTRNTPFLSMRNRILVIGCTGMLGHVVFRCLSGKANLDVYATTRNFDGISEYFSSKLVHKIIAGIDAEHIDTIIRALSFIQPKIIINCTGIIKQHKASSDPSQYISINAQFPHRLSLLCQLSKARLIHISTDGVFDGKQGGYTEQDEANISDVYAMSKYLGEVNDPHCLTIRTSIIGHELKKRTGLVEWLLSQKGKVKGYTRAIYSGLPTIELAEIIRDYILPNDNLSGTYHVSSEPISKYELLHLIADRYGKKITIEPLDDVVINRSLDSSAFQRLSGYRPPAWPELVNKMYRDYYSHKGTAYI